MQELRSAGPLVARKDVSVQLAVKVVGAKPAAVGHWNTTVATAGVHRRAHLTACSITFHTAKHTHTHTVHWVSLLNHFPAGMPWFMFQQEARDR